MAIRRRPGYLLWVGGPVPPGAAAITLGRLIIVRTSARGDERLLRHELVHVDQWARLGAVGFLGRYVGWYLFWRGHAHGHWDAYRRIPLEVEAEWRARTGSPASDTGERGARPLRSVRHRTASPA